MALVINLIQLVIQILTILVIVHAFLSFFMSPYHPIREAVDRVVNPMLNPIRKIVPPFGMLDISPIILILVLQLIGTILIRFLIALAG